jgi:CTP synthase (UTP-ammonia lyase)
VLAELGAQHHLLPTSDPSSLDQASRLDGLWCVPGSPYHDMDAALEMIRLARERGVTFLGTCGGFQHALIEYARNVAGLAGAEHAESSPTADLLVIEPLACSLVGAEGEIRPLPETMLAGIYGDGEHRERYHCGYGLAAAFRHLLDDGPLRSCAVDREGELRAVEMRQGTFWLATLYQPELSSPPGRPHAVIEAFVAACRSPYTS